MHSNLKVNELGTYVILIPHDVQESVHRQVEISSCEAGESSKNCADEEHSVEILLSVGEYLLHVYLL